MIDPNFKIDWDRIAKQKMMYQELDKFKPGEHLQYFPVPADELKKWFDAKEKKSYQDYLAREKLRKKEMSKEFKEMNNTLRQEEKIRRKKGGSLDEFIKQ